MINHYYANATIQGLHPIWSDQKKHPPGLQRWPWRVPGSLPRHLWLGGWLLASCLSQILGGLATESWSFTALPSKNAGLTMGKWVCLPWEKPCWSENWRWNPTFHPRNWPMLRPSFNNHIPQFWWLKRMLNWWLKPPCWSPTSPN